MPKYDVHVVCDQCSMPHPVNVRLELSDEGLNGKLLSDLYSDQIPSQIAFMQSNKYRCPHTKQLFAASDLRSARLVGVD